MSSQAIIVLPSKYTVRESIDRLVILLQSSDMMIYARINRQAEAQWYGKTTRPLEFILFDDLRLSTRMVEKNPVIALCFPMRLIAWEDAIGRCWIAFKDLSDIMKEFHMDREDFQWPHLRQAITLTLSE